MKIIVLGAAAGGGLPQWNCACDNCRLARQGTIASATQTSLAISANGSDWFVINAAPDMREQLNRTRELHPRSSSARNSPICGVILTNAEIDAVAGLLTMREGSPFTVYAHQSVLDTLAQNNIFNVLRQDRVRRSSLALDELIKLSNHGGLSSGLAIRAFSVAGKGAWYLEGEPDKGTAADGDTLALEVVDMVSGTSAFIIPACAGVTDDLASRLRNAALVLFDGTLWHDNEMRDAGLSHKSGRDMGHLSMSGEDGTIAAISDLGIARKIFIHINNSNPVWQPQSEERSRAVQAGWEIAFDGMEITL